MNYHPTVLHFAHTDAAVQAMKAIGSDPAGIRIMAPKAIFRVIKLEQIPSKEANLLKQTFLAKGGEVAVARGTADLSVDTTDVIICATLGQYQRALAQLKIQPWGLPRVAAAIESVLTDQGG